MSKKQPKLTDSCEGTSDLHTIQKVHLSSTNANAKMFILSPDVLLQLGLTGQLNNATSNGKSNEVTLPPLKRINADECSTSIQCSNVAASESATSSSNNRGGTVTSTARQTSKRSANDEVCETSSTAVTSGAVVSAKTALRTASGSSRDVASGGERKTTLPPSRRSGRNDKVVISKLPKDSSGVSRKSSRHSASKGDLSVEKDAQSFDGTSNSNEIDETEKRAEISGTHRNDVNCIPLEKSPRRRKSRNVLSSESDDISPGRSTRRTRKPKRFDDYVTFESTSAATANVPCTDVPSKNAKKRNITKIAATKNAENLSSSSHESVGSGDPLLGVAMENESSDRTIENKEKSETEKIRALGVANESPQIQNRCDRLASERAKEDTTVVVIDHPYAYLEKQTSACVSPDARAKEVIAASDISSFRTSDAQISEVSISSKSTVRKEVTDVDAANSLLTLTRTSTEFESNGAFADESDAKEANNKTVHEVAKEVGSIAKAFSQLSKSDKMIENAKDIKIATRDTPQSSTVNENTSKDDRATRSLSLASRRKDTFDAVDTNRSAVSTSELMKEDNAVESVVRPLSTDDCDYDKKKLDDFALNLNNNTYSSRSLDAPSVSRDAETLDTNSSIIRIEETVSEGIKLVTEEVVLHELEVSGGEKEIQSIQNIEERSTEIPEETNDSDAAKKTSRWKKTLQSTPLADHVESSDGDPAESGHEEELVPVDSKVTTGRQKRKSRRGRGARRGRPKKHSALDDTEYVPRMSTESSKNMNTDKQEAKETDDGNSIEVDLQKDEQKIKCAKCGQELTKKQWTSHNSRRHNSTGWLVGEEQPDFENDPQLLKRTLSIAIKKRRGSLMCEKCETVKRSVLGFLSHMKFCGKTEDEKKTLLVTCPICNRVMMPSSMEIHERYHRQLEKEKEGKSNEIISAQEGGIREKRKAAQKAISKISEFTALVRDTDGIQQSKETQGNSPALRRLIQRPQLVKRIPGVLKSTWKKEINCKNMVSCKQPGCSFTSDSFDSICEHYATCNFTPRANFICKVCNFGTECQTEIMNHVAEQHSLDSGAGDSVDCVIDEEESTDDGNDDENAGMQEFDRQRMGQARRMRFIDREPRQDRIQNKLYAAAFRWTIEFELKNYQLALYDKYSPNPLILLENDAARYYLPELEKSIPTKKAPADSFEEVRKTEIQWRHWERFEGDLDEGTPTFFVGGPVWALAWLPIPIPMFSHKPDQYLAVSTHPTMESEYAVGKAHSGKNMIQIWNLGNLDHQSDSAKSPPTLSYAIVHSYGTAWCMEWCPSGCYDDDATALFQREGEASVSRRMGLLAVACSDGCVHVYSLPFPDELKFIETDENKWPIYKTDPVVTLVVNQIVYDKSKQNWQCTKLCWNKGREHDTLVAGFSNGYVALWDLTTESPIMIGKKGNTTFINAYQHFFAHSHAVSMVALIPYAGNRFLATAGWDKCYKFWDLENCSTPQSVWKKGIIVDGVWMMHWPCAVISLDDVLGLNHTNSYLIPLRDHGYKAFPILPTNSTTYTVAVSDHANGIAHGTLAGEVLTIFPHELLYAKDVEKILPQKRHLSSFVDVFDFKEAAATNPNLNRKRGKANVKEYRYMPDTYDGCKDRFGIIFCDSVANKTDVLSARMRKKILHNEMLTQVPPEEYPFMSVNRISWNPNAWSYLWLSVGYQCGLVRILDFTNKSSPEEENNAYLSQCAKTMLEKEADKKIDAS